MKAKRICAWCGKFLGWGDTSDGSPTHGICGKCEAKMLAELDKKEQGK